MNKKRFSIKYNTTSTNYPSGRVFDNEKQHTLYIDEVVNLLNWLINENKKLKEENASLKQRIRDIKYNNCNESFKLDAKISKEKDDKIKELEVKVLNLELEKEELIK